MNKLLLAGVITLSILGLAIVLSLINMPVFPTNINQAINNNTNSADPFINENINEPIAGDIKVMPVTRLSRLAIPRELENLPIREVVSRVTGITINDEELALEVEILGLGGTLKGVCDPETEDCSENEEMRRGRVLTSLYMKRLQQCSKFFIGGCSNITLKLDDYVLMDETDATKTIYQINEAFNSVK